MSRPDYNKITDTTHQGLRGRIQSKSGNGERRLRLIYRDGVYILVCSYSERAIPKEAGFKWNLSDKFWYTQESGIAAKFRSSADHDVKRKLDRLIISYQPWLLPLSYPAHETPYDFQKEAALFALSRSKSYLALQAGLGKTIVAAIIANSLKTFTLIISPPFLTRNIEIEFKKWSTWDPRIVRLDTREVPIYSPDILIVGDSIIHRAPVREEILERVDEARAKGHHPLLIVDEAHRFKTPEAMRTRALLGGNKEPGIIQFFERQVYLSGTPMSNRPIELYPILSRVAPETIDYMSRDHYGMKYCAGFFDGYGYDFQGASHLPELEERVKEKFMLRLKKTDVLTSLPAKTEAMVILGDAPSKLLKLDEKILKKISPEDLLAGSYGPDALATYRRELGLLKLKPGLEFIKSLLSDTDESILVFAYHREVIAKLAEGLRRFRPYVITGDTAKNLREEFVKDFQGSGKNRRLFIGNYLAMGLGYTLTKATRVVFFEFSWVPEGENDQASDRAHRIGQTEPVHIQYLIYQNSLDSKILQANFKKRKVVGYI